MKKIDLRSDTITLPTKEMLSAIDCADLGDDVFQEDPTINQLEELASKRFKKGIFCPNCYNVRTKDQVKRSESRQKQIDLSEKRKEAHVFKRISIKDIR